MVLEKSSCILCKSSEVLVERTYLSCLVCELKFKNKANLPAYKDEKYRYEQHNNKVTDQAYLNYLLKLFDIAVSFSKKTDLDRQHLDRDLNTYLKPRPDSDFEKNKQIKTVLDFGCGPTEGLKALVRQNQNKFSDFEVSSYDPIFFNNNLESKLGSKKYDIVYCSEVVEHFFDPLKDFKFIKSLLKKGGILAISTHFHTDILKIEGWWYYKDPTHVVFYNEITFNWLAKSLGFKKIFLEKPYVVFSV